MKLKSIPWVEWEDNQLDSVLDLNYQETSPLSYTVELMVGNLYHAYGREREIDRERERMERERKT